MTTKQRFQTALEGRTADRLPVTTHHVMPYFLEKYMDGMDSDAFFEHFGLDRIVWATQHKPGAAPGDFADPDQAEPGFLESRRVSSDQWRITSEAVTGAAYPTKRYTVHTPGGTLTTSIQSNPQTDWVSEHLIKEKGDIDLIANYVTSPLSDIDAVNAVAAENGDSALIRGHICCFDIYGQPGCWQDACCLYGTDKLVMETFDDPRWVHELLAILLDRKLTYARSLKGAAYDVLELGGGDASTTVISPAIFEEFVAPYDSQIIAAAHEAGQRISYHTCGGMMPILEQIAGMSPDAMETFTPPQMGGDTDLVEAKRRIGEAVCMIGGFDQFHYLQGCTPEQTRGEVRRCFEAAGAGGGYILATSDHFFDADLSLIEAYADEARRCSY